MRLKIIIISLLVIVASSTFAQKRIKREVHIGVKGGTTWSTLSISPNIRDQYTLGYTGGVALRYIEERFFGFIVELNLTQHGWGEEFANDDAAYKYTRTTNYLEIPFLTHIYFGKKNFRFFFNLGPQIGYCIGESTNTNFDPNTTIFSEYRETEQYYKSVEQKFDYGLVGGGGIEFRIKQSSFMLESRYYFGLSDIFNNSSADYFSVSSNQQIQLSLSYMFNIKK